MLDVQVGTTPTIFVRFYDEGGVPIAVDSPAAKVVDPFGLVFLSPTLSAGATTGQYKVNLNFPAGSTLGSYRITATGTTSSRVIASESFKVRLVDPQKRPQFVTLEEAKEHLGIPEDDRTRNSLLLRFIQVASEMVRTICNTNFEVRTLTERFRLDFRPDTIALREYPVHEVLNVTPAGLNYTLDSALGVIGLTPLDHGLGSKITLDTTFYDELEITYKGGPVEAPEPVREAVLEIVSILETGRGEEAVRSNTLGSQRLVFTDPRYKKVLELLNLYIRRYA